MRSKLLTDEDLLFIKEHYQNNGVRFCANKLGFSKNIKLIQHTANRMGLFVNPLVRLKNVRDNQPIKTDSDYSVNPQQFYKIKTKEVAYLLGFLWADGWVIQSKRNNSVGLEIKSTDFPFISKVLDTTGRWRKSKRTRNKIYHSCNAIISNKPLVDFLVYHGYKSKSIGSADSILSIIPEKFKRYWFLGLFDGDGWLYFNKKQKAMKFNICSSVDQDWTFAEKLFVKLDIKYYISKNKNHLPNGNLCRNSVINFSNRKSIEVIINYLYPNGYELGLKRKFKKADLIKKFLNDVRH